MESSQGDVDKLLHILEARETLKHGDATHPIFDDADHLHNTIDAIDAVHARDTLAAVRNMVANPEFDGSFHYKPFEEYPSTGKRRFSDLMSGRWAWKQSDLIAHDPETHGSMVVPIILGADKTTVSVATGNTEFHPVYMSIGNVTNGVRHAHGEAVIPIAFLAIPKVAREHADDNAFRLFRKQLYHASLAHILEPLREGMAKPVVMRCPDGHWRRVIFEIGPFIADYPEQVCLAGIVQGWCPKCLACPENLDDRTAAPRFRDHTDIQVESFDAVTLWDTFGTVADVVPFTRHFPRADIHQLLSPDLLHQLIKGTFKDHLVTWVEEYLHEVHGKAEAERIMDDIDRRCQFADIEIPERIASAPTFPGLRRFPEGCKFKQWTGDDSKALMKVYLPAITGHVPARMVKCIAALLDFCYLARRPSHDTDTLQLMDEALARFHLHRMVFIDEGLRPDGISLPCQHALLHYVSAIRLFGSPNGLCSSITESKHIRAVKKPWRRSSHNKPLGQIIRTNTRLSKLAAIRVQFTKRGMLDSDVITAARIEAGLDEDLANHGPDEGGDVMDADGPCADSTVTLAAVPAYTVDVAALSTSLHKPHVSSMIEQFLYNQLYGDEHHCADDVLPEMWPLFGGNI
ncbi:hypothetical protein EWM64_g5904 [Hericium alpestre]|uniref:CxC2-like cysteine cluster KDZ transposase-associated domain-containing protein n=1 Tax=Hericium alpestre TaxID=135208 RepID=A0A4Y9ZT80_9AGAM|nr:hypothetical protein EWM64_g5904 [Hericium alpestre]